MHIACVTFTLNTSFDSSEGQVENARIDSKLRRRTDLLPLKKASKYKQGDEITMCKYRMAGEE